MKSSISLSLSLSPVIIIFFCFRLSSHSKGEETCAPNSVPGIGHLLPLCIHQRLFLVFPSCA